MPIFNSTTDSCLFHFNILELVAVVSGKQSHSRFHKCWLDLRANCSLGLPSPLSNASGTYRDFSPHLFLVCRGIMEGAVRRGRSCGCRLQWSKKWYAFSPLPSLVFGMLLNGDIAGTEVCGWAAQGHSDVALPPACCEPVTAPVVQKCKNSRSLSHCLERTPNVSYVFQTKIKMRPWWTEICVLWSALFSKESEALTPKGWALDLGTASHTELTFLRCERTISSNGANSHSISQLWYAINILYYWK